MKPTLPQGTRDFNASTLRKRNYIFSTIKNVFELYGFEPLETPAMENLDTLMGKYGEEGDKLLFKILNNGLDNQAKLTQIQEGFTKLLEGKNSNAITERALKYDLTIPFARYVAMNHNQLTFPYKRYQMQPVWRADRPQKGRYREFYQCDADVVGSNSLLNEVELANIYATVFKNLQLEVEIKINSRKLLQALAEVCGGLDKMTSITVAIDKLDKIGLEKVKEEILSKGLNETQIATIQQYLQIDGSNTEKLQSITNLLGENQAAKNGIEELQFVLNTLQQINSPANVNIDFTLARGLNYYTGIIFEVKALNAKMGSIGGGGRYNDLTGLFGVANIPGVGISFGVDRIYDVLEELQLFPADIQSNKTVLFFNLGVEEATACLQLIQQLRANKIACELYHEPSKLDKQFKYAEKKQCTDVVIIGSKELAENTCTVKNISTGVQQVVRFDQLATTLATND